MERTILHDSNIINKLMRMLSNFLKFRNQPVIICGAVTVLVIGLQKLQVLETIELKIYDQMVQLLPDQGPDQRLLIISITEEDLQKWNWPLSGETLDRLFDKLEQYQIAIKQVLTEYHNWVSGAANLTDESCLIFDDNNHHYVWGFLGWDGKKRTNNIQVNIRIKNDKIWIEEDWTEEGIANELMKLGISNLDIVLAFHPPEERKYTAFATA